MKMAVMFAQDDGTPFFSGPTFFLGLIVICFLLMLITAVREWWINRKQAGLRQTRSDAVDAPAQDTSTDAKVSKADKKRAALEIKQRKKEAREVKKREKAAAKAEAKAAKAAKKAKNKRK